jgi:hypothetical protein
MPDRWSAPERTSRPAGQKKRVPAHVKTRAAAAGLWMLVGCGALGGLWAALARPQARAVAAPAAPSAVGPAGWAQLYVAAFLPAGQANTSGLGPFLAAVPNLDQVTAGKLAATSTTTVDAHVVSAGYWAVTVAAAVEELSGGVWQPLGVRFYDVGVLDRGGRFAATGLPSQVAGPAQAATPALANTSVSALTPGDAETDTVAQFLGAMLAGQGQISRYTPVGSPLAAVTPAPFRSVTVTGVSVLPARNRRPAEVSADVDATDATGQTQQLSYVVALDRQAGQWEVTDLLPAPPLAHP